MGPLLSDLARKMHIKTKKGDADPTKILIHATHDTCLAGLSSTLDIFDDRWVSRTVSDLQYDLVQCWYQVASVHRGNHI